MAFKIETTATEISVFLQPRSSAFSFKLLCLNGVKISFHNYNKKLEFYIKEISILFGFLKDTLFLKHNKTYSCNFHRMKPDIPRPWNAACWKFSRSFHLLCFHKSQNNWQILEDPCFYVSVICSVWKHLELQEKNDNVPPPWTLLITLYHQLENATTSNLQGDHLF